MTFTYSGNPSERELDAIRFLVGDTDDEEYFLEDEEILWLISIWSARTSVYYTASMAADSIAAKFAREVTVNSDSQTVSTSELQTKYQQLALELRAKHTQFMISDGIDVGGMLIWEMVDPTVKPLAFGRGMHDDPEAGIQDLGDRNAPYRPELYGY